MIAVKVGDASKYFSVLDQHDKAFRIRQVIISSRINIVLKCFLRSGLIV